MIQSAVVENNMDFPEMKLFLNGAQLVSIGFKEDLMSAFKGMPFVSIHSVVDEMDIWASFLSTCEIFEKLLGEALRSQLRV